MDYQPFGRAPERGPLKHVTHVTHGRSYVPPDGFKPAATAGFPRSALVACEDNNVNVMEDTVHDHPD